MDNSRGNVLINLPIEFQTIKSKTEVRIEQFICDFLEKTPGKVDIARNAISVLEKEGYFVGSMSEEELLFAALLSIVLSDIQCQFHAVLREENKGKIQSICKRRGINMKFVENITPLWAHFVNLFFQNS